MHKNRIRELYASWPTIISGFTLILAISFIAIGCDSIVDQKTDTDTGIETSGIAGAFSMVQSSEITCIDPDASAYNKVNESKTVEWGNKRNPFEKTVEIEYYNTHEQFVLRVKSTEMIANVLVDDESIKDFDGTVAAGDWQEFTLDLEEGDTQTFSLKVAGSGPPVYFEVNYTLLGECAKGCGDVTFTYNGSEVTYGTVTGVNDRCWLDRNLGATRAAESSTDTEAYGDYFAFSNAVNACPVDFRLATQAEWEAERLSWISNNAAGAIASSLKLTMAGFHYSFGSLQQVGSAGHYWSGTTYNTLSRSLSFSSNTATMGLDYRAHGLSVRCLKEDTSD